MIKLEEIKKLETDFFIFPKLNFTSSPKLLIFFGFFFLKEVPVLHHERGALFTGDILNSFP